MHRKSRAGRIGGILAAATAAVLVALPSGAASASNWTCTATAVTAQVSSGEVIDPIRAGSAERPCGPAVVGLPNVGEALSLAPGIQAVTAYASTTIEAGRPMDQKPAAAAGVEGLSFNSGETVVLGVDAARSTAAASCVAGAPKVETSSVVANITLGGQPIVLDGVLQPITDALSDALGALIEVRLNEPVLNAEGGVVGVRAARVTLLGPDTPLLNVIIAESRIGNVGAVCDPNDPSNKGGGSGSGSGSGSIDACPRGSVYDVSRQQCVIPVPGSQTDQNPQGDLTGEGSLPIGKPYELPKGGTVMTLEEARRRYKSPCLSGPGPKFVVVGTNGRDLITGSNRADRILGRGGRDRLDGGREDDCIDGGSARDVMTGGQDQDRIYGFSGNDSLNGDTGNDRLNGGSGNDTHVGAFGADIVKAGPGNDKINVAVAGRRARVDGGSGSDVARVNQEERHLVRNVERVLVVRNRG